MTKPCSFKLMMRYMQKGYGRDKSPLQSEVHASFSSSIIVFGNRNFPYSVETTDDAYGTIAIHEKPEINSIEPSLPIEVYVASETGDCDLQNRDASLSEALAKIQSPYDLQHKKLLKLREQLRLSLLDEGDCLSETEVAVEATLPVLYLTPFGMLSFDQLHERTPRYAAYVLHHTYQVSPTDINDGLQAGYTHLWEQLQQNPAYLEGKQMAWIGKGLVYKALHAIRRDWKYQNHIEMGEGRTSTDKRGSQSWESRQVDTRVDIQQAITEVAHQIMTTKRGKQADHDIWALYGLTMLKVSSSELSRFLSRARTVNTPRL